MKTLFLFLFCLLSFFGFSQTNIVLKVRLHHNDEKGTVFVQKNKETPQRIKVNYLETVNVQQNDVLSFYVNENLVEAITVSQKIIDRKNLNVLITETTVLDELEIEYTNLNNRLGFNSTPAYTRSERAVKRDRQFTYDDKSSATGNIKLDGLVNKLSGRAKTNKKALSIENEITTMERFLKVYPADYLYDNYKLPKDKAPYFALKMIDFINEDTKIDSPAFKILMEEQLLNFKYD